MATGGPIFLPLSHGHRVGGRRVSVPEQTPVVRCRLPECIAKIGAIAYLLADQKSSRNDLVLYAIS